MAALAFGADGIAMGTRFLLTRESPVPEATKQRYLDCVDPAEIVRSTALDGLPQRMILNEFLRQLEQAGPLKKWLMAATNSLAYRRFSGASLASLLRAALAMRRDGELSTRQAMMSANAPMIIQRAMVAGLPEHGVLPSGQVAGVIDTLPSCEALIHAIVSEAQAQLQRLAAIATAQQEGSHCEQTL